MEVKTQTVEQFLVEQLEIVAPGKYALANVLELFKSKLRFQCRHLKGGYGQRIGALGYKDYNLSIFTFPNGVTEIKCLYNCGLKIRSDEKELSKAFSQLADLPTSNTRAQSEYRAPSTINPGPVPTYSDAYRQQVRESTDRFWKSIEQGIESGRIKPNDPVLGGEAPHPDPIEAPDSIVERGIAQAFKKALRKPVLKAQVVVQDSIPAPAPDSKKIRKTQSRKRGK